MTIEERVKKQWEEYEYPSGNLYPNVFKDGYIKGATDQQKIDIEKACEYLDKNLSRCIECYDEDIVVTRLKEDVLDDFRKAMNEKP